MQRAILMDICNLLNPKLQFMRYNANETEINLGKVNLTRDELIEKLRDSPLNYQPKDIVVAIKIYNLIADTLIEQWKKDGLQDVLNRYEGRCWTWFSPNQMKEDVISFFCAYDWYNPETNSLIEPIFDFINELSPVKLNKLVEKFSDETVLEKMNISLSVDDNDSGNEEVEDKATRYWSNIPVLQEGDVCITRAIDEGAEIDDVKFLEVDYTIDSMTYNCSVRMDGINYGSYSPCYDKGLCKILRPVKYRNYYTTIWNIHDK